MVVKLDTISDEVYFTIWQNANLNVVNLNEFFEAGVLSSYEGTIEAGNDVGYMSVLLIKPNDKIYYNIHNYATEDNSDHWGLGDNPQDPYEVNGFARYIVITDIFIKR